MNRRSHHTRIKSFRISVPLETIQSIIIAAASLMLDTLSINSKVERTLESLREQIEPAYEIIASELSTLLHREVLAKDLTSLAMELRPTFGSMTVSVVHVEEGCVQSPYSFRILSVDGQTIFTRNQMLPNFPGEGARADDVWSKQNSL